MINFNTFTYCIIKASPLAGSGMVINIGAIIFNKQEGIICLNFCERNINTLLNLSGGKIKELSINNEIEKLENTLKELKKMGMPTSAAFAKIIHTPSLFIELSLSKPCAFNLSSGMGASLQLIFKSHLATSAKEEDSVVITD